MIVICYRKIPVNTRNSCTKNLQFLYAHHKFGSTTTLWKLIFILIQMTQYICILYTIPIYFPLAGNKFLQLTDII